MRYWAVRSHRGSSIWLTRFEVDADLTIRRDWYGKKYRLRFGCRNHARGVALIVGGRAVRVTRKAR